MSEPNEIEDVAAANEESLQTLVRAISLSQGEFSLILVRCNYGELRERILQRLRELSVSVDGDTPLQIRELVLDKSVKTLYTTIQKALQNEQPNALIIFGLESVNAIDKLIVASNQVREEFRKRFPFPIVLWMNDEVLQKFLRLAPDFDSWTTTVEFTIATTELIDTLHKNADSAFTSILNAGAGKFLDNAVLNIALYSGLRAELASALRDLQSRGEALDPELEANLQFLQGREAQAKEEMAKARQHYQQSLAFWQQSNRIDRHGCLLFYLGLWCRRSAVLHRAEYLEACRQAKGYFQQCIQVFQEGNRPDLAAKFINPLGEVLTRLEEWDELEKVAHTSIDLHEAYQDTNHLASSGYAYGLLAEVALSRSQWKEAKKYAELAIAKNNEPDVVNHVLNSANQDWSWSWKQYQGLYLLLLAKSQKGLKQLKEAVKNLEKAREDSNPQYDPQLYIDILDELRLLYFQQGQYLEAFKIKLEQGAIQAEYGFRPFIGAGSLRPLKRVINPAIESADPKVRAQQRLSASGRLQDINNLLERIGRNDYKLIVIHGLSGVGKSSLLWAGLEPSLKQQAIGDRDALPVVLQFYTNWVSDLGERLAKALSELEFVGGSHSFSPPQPPLLRGEQEVISGLTAGEQEKFQSPPLQGGLGGSTSATAGEQEKFQSPPLQGGLGRSTSATAGEQEQFQSPPLQGGLGGYLNSPEAIIQQLRINAERNLLTVLIFDQFEEFFFVCTDLLERRKFYQFLQICLNLPFVKVVMSLREDYLHYLLECARLTDLDVINNNILDKSIRYYLGDFSPERAKSVIRELTERSQFYLAPELIDEMVKDLAGELGEIRPIELQVVGAQLQTDNITTLDKYRQLGANPKEKLVQLSLEEVVKDCGTGNERAAQLVLYFLTNETGTRPLKTRDELVTDFETVDLSAEVGKLELVLQVLVGSGLVFQIPDAPADRYQLVHDYLVSFIRQSEQAREVDERKQERQQRQLIEAKLNQVLKRQLQYALIGMFLLLGSTISAVWFGLEATKSAINADFNSSSSKIQRILSANQEFDALIESLKTAKELKQKFGVDSDTRMQFAATFQQAVYTVRERNRLEGHSYAVNSVSFSPDGKTLASGSRDKTVKLWSVSSGKLLQTLSGHSDFVMSVSFSPDGKTLASGSRDKTVKLWSVSSGKLLQTLSGHSDFVMSVSFSPDGKTLASGSRDKTVKLWSVSSGKLLQTLSGHSDFVIGVSFSPDGKTLASGSRDKTVKLWSVSGQLLQTFKGHSDSVRGVSFSPDGKTLASGSSDKTVKLWSVSGQLLQTLSGHSDSVRSVSFSPVREAFSEGVGKTLASGSWDKTVKLWSVSGKLLQTLSGHSDAVIGVSFSPDGKTLASGSSDKTVKLWSVSGKLLQTLSGHSDFVMSVSFSPVREAFSEGVGKTLASGSRDKTVKLWSVDSGKLLQTLSGHSDFVIGVSFSPDGKTLASGSRDKTVKLWSVSGQLLQTFKGHSDSVRGVSFSPDGKTLASGSRDKTVKLWSVDSGKLLQTLSGHSDSVYGVSFSPDGKTLASASSDNTVKLWSVDSGKLLQTLSGHSDFVYGVSFSPDGKTIASGSGDKTVKLWNLDLDDLQVRGCDWVRDYLQNNPNVSAEDKRICEGIVSKK